MQKIVEQGSILFRKHIFRFLYIIQHQFPPDIIFYYIFQNHVRKSQNLRVKNAKMSYVCVQKMFILRFCLYFQKDSSIYGLSFLKILTQSENEQFFAHIRYVATHFLSASPFCVYCACPKYNFESSNTLLKCQKKTSCITLFLPKFWPSINF